MARSIMEVPISPTEYDVIIVGTGFQESVVAGALARVGRNVLHVDAPSHYGSHWASLELDSFVAWANSGGKIPPPAGVADVEDSLVNGFLEEAWQAEVGRDGSVRSEEVSVSVSGEAAREDGAHEGQQQAVGSTQVPREEGVAREEGVHEGVEGGGNTAREEDASRVGEEEEHVANGPPTTESILRFRNLSAIPLQSSNTGALYRHVAVHDLTGGPLSSSPGPSPSASSPSFPPPSPLGMSRDYSLDLCGPRVVLCGGNLVSLLLQSGATHYLEFKAVDALLMWHHGRRQLVSAPASRSDVFQDRTLSLADKRHLMRFLKIVTDYAAANAPSNRFPSETNSAPAGSGEGAAVGGAGDGGPSAPPAVTAGVGGGGGAAAVGGSALPAASSFAELLAAQKLPKLIEDFILYAVAMASDLQTADTSSSGSSSGGASSSSGGASSSRSSSSIVADGAGEPLSVAEGLRRLALYFRSVGRYGAPSGMIWPMYGSGELPQAFCRIAAVKGSIYVLRRPIASLLLHESNGACAGVCTESGQPVFAPRVLLGPSFVPTPSTTATTRSASEIQLRQQEQQQQQQQQQQAALGQEEQAQGEAADEDEQRQPDPEPKRFVARGVCITDASLAPDKPFLMAVVPPTKHRWRRSLPRQQNLLEQGEVEEGGGGRSSEGRPRQVEEDEEDVAGTRTVRVFQVAGSSAVCPTGKFLVYLSCLCEEDEVAEKLLRPTLDLLFRCDLAAVSTATAATTEAVATDAATEVGAEADSEERAEAATATAAAAEEAAAAATPIATAAAGQEQEKEMPQAQGGQAQQEGVDTGCELGGGKDGRAEEQQSEAAAASTALPGEEGREHEGAGVREAQSSEEQHGNDSRPRVLWCAFFVQQLVNRQDVKALLPAGVWSTSAPDDFTHFEPALDEALQIFSEMAPGEQFYPPSDNPGDGDDDEDGIHGGGRSASAEAADGAAASAEAGNASAANSVAANGEAQIAETANGDGANSEAADGADGAAAPAGTDGASAEAATAPAAAAPPATGADAPAASEGASEPVSSAAEAFIPATEAVTSTAEDLTSVAGRATLV